MRERILVTSALPYANGPLHVGHIAGAYLPADTYVRYNRLAGADIIYVGGPAEHGTAIEIKALMDGVTPKELVDF
jgi:methionyl-tRNA synthetase